MASNAAWHFCPLTFDNNLDKYGNPNLRGNLMIKFVANLGHHKRICVLFRENRLNFKLLLSKLMTVNSVLHFYRANTKSNIKRAIHKGLFDNKINYLKRASRSDWSKCHYFIVKKSLASSGLEPRTFGSEANGIDHYTTVA